MRVATLANAARRGEAIDRRQVGIGEVRPRDLGKRNDEHPFRDRVSGDTSAAAGAGATPASTTDRTDARGEDPERHGEPGPRHAGASGEQRQAGEPAGGEEEAERRPRRRRRR